MAGATLSLPGQHACFLMVNTSYPSARVRACEHAGVALSGLLAVLWGCMDMKATIAGKHHYLLFCLATALKPRMLLTVDEEGKLLPVPCRWARNRAGGGG